MHAYLQSVCALAGSMRIYRVSRFAEHFHAIPYLLAVLGYGRRRKCAFAFDLQNTIQFALFCFSRRERTYLNLAQPVLCNRHKSHRCGDQAGVWFGDKYDDMYDQLNAEVDDHVGGMFNNHDDDMSDDQLDDTFDDQCDGNVDD